MIHYSHIMLFKMIPTPGRADPVQSFSENDGYVLTRDDGDCVVTVRKLGWAQDIPLSNVSTATRKPVDERPMLADKPSIDSKFGHTKKGK